MPPETSAADPAPTRRSTRPRSAAPSTPGPVPDEQHAEAPRAVPTSRRAAREALRAQAAASLDLTPMAAATGRRIVDGEPEPVRVSTESVEQVFAESVVVVSDSSAADAAGPAPAEEQAAAKQASDDHDPFLEASAVFRTQAVDDDPAAADETPESSDADAAEPEASAHVAPRRRTGRRALAAAATVGVMGLAGLLAVSVTLPAEALAAAQSDAPMSATSLVAAGGESAPVIDEDEIQAFVAPSDVQNESLDREEDYSSISLVDLAAEEGIRYSDSLYTNDPDAAIQWPFVVGVGMSSGYGMRWGRLHAGIDLVPGEGAPIQAIADGVVRKATESGGGYGVTVYVDHIIDGKVVTSHYSHMQYGSMRVKTGDKVHVGDILGLVGNTGHSYGAHLHFEILINDATIDPLPWMRANAGRYDGVTPVS